jgi:hypothetical protein
MKIKKQNKKKCGEGGTSAMKINGPYMWDLIKLYIVFGKTGVNHIIINFTKCSQTCNVKNHSYIFWNKLQTPIYRKSVMCV